MKFDKRNWNGLNGLGALVICRALRRARAHIDLSADAEASWYEAWRSYAQANGYRWPYPEMTAEAIMALGIMAAASVFLLHDRLTARRW